MGFDWRIPGKLSILFAWRMLQVQSLVCPVKRAPVEILGKIFLRIWRIAVTPNKARCVGSLSWYEVSDYENCVLKMCPHFKYDYWSSAKYNVI